MGYFRHYSFTLFVAITIYLAHADSDDKVYCTYNTLIAHVNRYAHEKGNGFYNECDPQGFFVEKQCPNGGLFNQKTLSCSDDENDDSNEDVSRNTLRLSPWQIAVCHDVYNGTKVANYEDNCQSFFICDNDWPREVSCATGLLFNALTGFCDWPRNVDCECKLKDCPPPLSGLENGQENVDGSDNENGDGNDNGQGGDNGIDNGNGNDDNTTTEVSTTETSTTNDTDIPSPSTPPPTPPTPSSTTEPSWSSTVTSDDLDQICVEGRPEGNGTGQLPPTTQPTTPPVTPTEQTTTTPTTPAVSTCPPCICETTTSVWTSPDTTTEWSSTTVSSTTAPQALPPVDWNPPATSQPGCPPWGCIEGRPEEETSPETTTTPETTTVYIPTAPAAPTASSPGPNSNCPPSGCREGRPEEEIPTADRQPLEQPNIPRPPHWRR